MKHMEEMKIAGLAMALCIVMLGIYIVVPKDGTTSHLTAIPDNNAAQPATDSTSQGQGSADTGNDDYFPIYTEDSYDSEADNSYSDGSGDNYSNDNSGDTADNSDYNTDSSDNGDNGDDEVTDVTPSDDPSDNTDSGTGDVIDDSSDTGDTSDSDLGNDTGDDDTVEIY